MPRLSGDQIGLKRYNVAWEKAGSNIKKISGGYFYTNLFAVTFLGVPFSASGGFGRAFGSRFCPK